MLTWPTSQNSVCAGVKPLFSQFTFNPRRSVRLWFRSVWLIPCCWDYPHTSQSSKLWVHTDYSTSEALVHSSFSLKAWVLNRPKVKVPELICHSTYIEEAESLVLHNNWNVEICIIQISVKSRTLFFLFSTHIKWIWGIWANRTHLKAG